MRRFRMTVRVDAPVDRVWRALCDPGEVVAWDSGVKEAIDPPPDYPRPGQAVRWHYVGGTTLLDRPQEVVPERRLRSILVLGSYYMDETYELAESDGVTTLLATVDLTVQRGLLGPVFEHLWPGRGVRKGFEASLAGLKRHCEGTDRNA